MRAARRCRRLPASSARTGPRSSAAWTRACSWGRWRLWVTCRARGGRRRSRPRPGRGWSRWGTPRPETGATPRSAGHTRLLARHAREHCAPAGHPSLARLASGTVSKILRRARPSDEQRRLQGPGRAAAGAQVLVLRQWIQLEPAGGTPSDGSLAARVWPAGRPGDTPEPRPHTVAGGGSGPRHRPGLRGAGPAARQPGLPSRSCNASTGPTRPGVRVRLLLDRHAAHRAAATRRYLARTPNRFELAFRPTARFLASAGGGAVRPRGARAAARGAPPIRGRCAENASSGLSKC